MSNIILTVFAVFSLFIWIIVSADTISTPECPVDFTFDTGDYLPKESEQEDEISCRPFTDAECARRYGDDTIFSSERHRCVWSLPLGVSPPQLQVPPATADTSDACALLRLLQTTLSVMHSAGVPSVPKRPDGGLPLPLRCGRVDLRPWSGRLTSVSLVSLVSSASAASIVSSGEESRSMARPGWALGVLVVLSVVCLGGLLGLAALLIRLRAPVRSPTQQREEEMIDEKNSLARPSQRTDDLSDNHDVNSQTISPSSATEGTQRPTYIMNTSVETRSPLASVTSIFATPREMKSEENVLAFD